MPRKSAESLSTLAPVAGRSSVMLPPPGLSKPAVAVWREVVQSVATDHFRASDAPLLRTYCEATALADQAAQKLDKEGAIVAGGKVSPWLVVHEKATRTQNTTALRLRLCPSARTDPKSVGRREGQRVPTVNFSRGIDDE